MDNPAELLKKINIEISDILKDNDKSIYFTAFYAILDNDGTLTYCKAGHLHQYLIETKNNKVSTLTTSGFIIGISEDMNMLFENQKINVTTGDKIVLLTDGILEATSENGEVYGEERLIASFLKNSSSHSNVMLDDLVSHLNQFVSIENLKDDATAFIIEVK